MAALTVNQVTTAGINTPALVAAGAGGDTFVNNGRTAILVKNTNVATRRVVVDAKRACEYGVDHDTSTVVPATTGDMQIGPFPADRYGNVCDVSYPDGVTGVTIAVISV